MGVEGLFGYLNREKVEGAFKQHSIEDFLQQIRLFQENNRKSPKILFDLRAFNNYYEQTVRDVIFGCRFNVIKKDFESLLASLRAAGAELYFVSKKQSDKLEEVRLEKFDSSYEKGLQYVEILSQGESTQEITKRVSRQRIFPWQETTIHVLVQSAQKFGRFRESDCFQNSVISHIELAEKENMYAICGLNTSYLFHRGNWKIIFPAKDFRSKMMVFKEFDREKILQHFRFNHDQFQLFGVLGGKINTTLENVLVLKDHFKKDRFTNFQAIATFVLKYAPRDKFPLQHNTIDRILLEIFGYSTDQLREDFIKAMSYESPDKSPENCNIPEKTKAWLQNDSFSSLAESILYDIPFEILSPFLDIKATDMKPLKDLTLGWVERFGGILLSSIDDARPFSIIYRLPETLEKYSATPILPPGILDWNGLITNEQSMNDKFLALEFLFGDTITIGDLKKIPIEYLMHVIITMHLLKNDSMTLNEALAMTKTVCDKNERRYTVYPEKVNARAFRVSALYEKLFSLLLMILSPLGLKDFIAELQLDNVLFQNNLKDANENSIAGDLFKNIMKHIK